MVPITSCDTAGSFLLLGCNNGSIYYIGTHRQVYVFSVCHTVYGFFFYSIIPFKPLVKCHRQRCSSLCEPSSTALAFSLQTRSNLVTLIHDDHCCAYQTFQALKQIKNEYLKNPKIVKYSGTVLINTDVFLLHAFIILYEILIKQPWPPPPI